MRIYLDGEFFAEGDSLDVIAEIAQVDISRLSFHPNDLRERKEQQAIARFSDLLREKTGSDTNDFAMSLAQVKHYKAYKAGETREDLDELEALGDVVLQKIYEIRTAEDPDAVELP